MKLAYHTVEKRYCPETHFTKLGWKKLVKNSFYTNKETRKEVTVEKWHRPRTHFTKLGWKKISQKLISHQQWDKEISQRTRRSSTRHINNELETQEMKVLKNNIVESLMIIYYYMKSIICFHFDTL